MQSETGNKEFPIWLLGDSNPKNWEMQLITPLDARHPARHNIWTPIIDKIQDEVYREKRLRIETQELYIRNAIENPNEKPSGNLIQWKAQIEQHIENFAAQVNEKSPVFVFTFGSFAYEFARRTQQAREAKHYRFWSTKELGREFSRAIAGFDAQQTNIFPLLHATIARGYFLQSHTYFCTPPHTNYFDYVGEKIAQVLLFHCLELPIWIRS